MHPWTKAYRDLYTQDQIEEMNHTWYSEEELKAKKIALEEKQSWDRVRELIQGIVDKVHLLSIPPNKK